MGSYGINLRALSWDDVKITINKTRYKIAVLNWHPGLPGANELNCCEFVRAGFSQTGTHPVILFVWQWLLFAKDIYTNLTETTFKDKLGLTHYSLNKVDAICRQHFYMHFLDFPLKFQLIPYGLIDNKSALVQIMPLLSGVLDLWDRNKILSGGDLSHYQVPHCIRVFFYFVWFVFIHHNFQFYFELCTYIIIKRK